MKCGTDALQTDKTRLMTPLCRLGDTLDDTLFVDIMFR